MPNQCTCRVCGTSFLVAKPSQAKKRQVCSRACANRLRNLISTCEHCGKSFPQRHRAGVAHRFCGQDCYIASRRVSRTCCDCGNPTTSYTASRCRACFTRHRVGKNRLGIPPPNPSGLCMCGCGQPAPIAKQSDSAKGELIDHPIRYISGHYGRLSVEYVEESRGYETPCWIWQGGRNNSGYGSKARGMAHRAYYEQEFGQVPEGWHLHHQCEVRECVNPSHLVPLTVEEHNRLHRCTSSAGK